MLLFNEFINPPAPAMAHFNTSNVTIQHILRKIAPVRLEFQYI